jgi:uncharacterized YccA/Bax inhibitor family protein
MSEQYIPLRRENAVLNEQTFKMTASDEIQEAMTVRGAVKKTALLLTILALSAAGGWLYVAYDARLHGIPIWLGLTSLAALNLVLDFDLIESGARDGAPRYMEWYGAFGLMVTLIWLYLEILELLIRIYASSDDN